MDWMFQYLREEGKGGGGDLFKHNSLDKLFIQKKSNANYDEQSQQQ